MLYRPLRQVLFMLTMLFVIILATQPKLIVRSQESVQCPALVQEALTAIQTNCNPLDRNSACYGYNLVAAEFNAPQPDEFFTQTSDVGALSIFTSIQTAPLIRSLDQWGIALMSVQANLPRSLPGQSAIFMLVGDAEVESAIDPNTAVTEFTTPPIEVTTLNEIALHFAPQSNSAQVHQFPANVILLADAITPEGAWVRLAGDNPDDPFTGWALAAQLGGVDANALQVIEANAVTPMQAFYLRTNIGNVECEEAPNALVVQGPQRMQVQLNVNGAEVRLGSTVVFQTIETNQPILDLLRQQYNFAGTVGGLLKIIVLDGEAIIDPDTPNERRIPEGSMTYICLSPDADLGAENDEDDLERVSGCGALPPVPITAEEIAQFVALENVNLNYPITMPEIEVTETPTPTNTIVQGGGFVFATNTPILPPTATALPIFPTDPPYVPPPAPTNTPEPPPPTSTPTPTYGTPEMTFAPTSTPCMPFPGNIADGDIAGLINAIDLANDEECFPGMQTIMLAAGGTYTFSAAVSNGDLNGSSMLPVILSQITIVGNNATLMNSGGSARLVGVASSGDLTIESLTASYFGAPGSNGGAIYNEGFTYIIYSTFNNGNNINNGGAFYNTNSLEIYSSTIANNYISLNGSGVYNAGSLYSHNSTFANNQTMGAGGGIYNAAGAFATISQNTFSNNSAYGGGGGIYTDGNINAWFSTFYGNSSGVGGSALAGSGSLTIKNSLIAQSSGSACAASSITAQGNNYSYDSTCAGFTADSNVNEIGALASNGGATQTHMLYAGNPAINGVADCTDLYNNQQWTDQRGIYRPTATDPEQCDAGSLELTEGDL